MAPRFMERLQRQSDTLKQLYGVPQFDPPPYTRSTSRTTSSVSNASTASISLSEASTAPSTVASTFSTLPSYQQATQRFTYKEAPCIPRGSLVLVTGANSWHGMHIADQLLREGYRVRGAVRDAHKALQTTEHFAARYGSGYFETVIVLDMAVPGAYNTAVRGCSGVIHAAAVRTMSANPYDVIPQTIIGALNVLEAALKEPRIRRVVHCSSVLAARDLSSTKNIAVTSDSWNMSAFRAAWDLPPYKPDRAQSVLASAAVQTEQTVWKWYREKRPNFILNCVLPDTFWGEFLLPQHANSSFSGQLLKTIQSCEPDVLNCLPPHHYADIEDSAVIHVAALILPGVMNERLFVTAEPCDASTVSSTMPDIGTATRALEQQTDQTAYKEAPRAEELLVRMRKHGWTDLATSIRRANRHVSNG